MSSKALPSETDLLTPLELPRDNATVKKQQANLRPPVPVSEVVAVNKQKPSPPPVEKHKLPKSTDVAERFLSDLDVAKRYGVSRPTVWRWRKTNPDFPDPVQISPGTTRWALSDLLRFEAGIQAKLGRDQAQSAAPVNSGGK